MRGSCLKPSAVAHKLARCRRSGSANQEARREQIFVQSQRIPDAPFGACLPAGARYGPRAGRSRVRRRRRRRHDGGHRGRAQPTRVQPRKAGTATEAIWVLLPDSATSPRWETDDRPYFDQAFSDAGVEHTIVNAEGDAATQQSQAEQAIADGAERDRPDQHRHRLRRHDHRPGEGGRRPGDRVRPLQHRQLGWRGLRELRQRRSRRDDGRGPRADRSTSSGSTSRRS